MQYALDRVSELRREKEEECIAVNAILSSKCYVCLAFEKAMLRRKIILTATDVCGSTETGFCCTKTAFFVISLRIKSNVIFF